jgi:hypothetical protein
MKIGKCLKKNFTHAKTNIFDYGEAKSENFQPVPYAISRYFTTTDLELFVSC